MITDTVPSFGGMTGQVFYSELAGHLFPARGTDGPNRISDTFFAEERQRRLENSQDRPTRMPGSSVDPRLPTSNHEEIATGTEALRSQGLILLDDQFPNHRPSDVPPIASLAYLRLQPPDLSTLGFFARTNIERQRRAYFQLMLLVAYDWWDLLSSMMDQFYKTLAELDQPDYYFGNNASCWADALSLACLRGHGNALRCLLRFFVPMAVDIGGSRCGPKVLTFPMEQCNLLEAIARQGLGRPEWEGDSKLYLPPDILEQLRLAFANTELLTTNTKQGLNPLRIALEMGDGTLSELFISWLRPSDGSKLVLPDSGVPLLAAACEGRLLTLAKYLADAGARFVEEPWYYSSLRYLYGICESTSIPPEEAIEWVTFLHELGADLFALQRGDPLNLAAAIGRTPLHLAAASGKVSVVRYIIARTRSRQQRHPKDQSGKTPLMLAKSAEVMHEFAPWQPNSDGDPAKNVCMNYYASTKQWPKLSHYRGGRSFFPTVNSLLYDEDSSQFFKKGSSDEFVQWIHIPANNIDWCEDLLVRWLLDGDGRCDIQNYEVAQQAFDQQHVSHTPQGRFFRPGVYCPKPSRRIVFIAAPYIDFETSSNVEKLQKALQVSESHRPTASDFTSPDQDLYDTYISSTALHPRRTLDQYIYYNMDTRERDTDQVVQRCQRAQQKRVGVRSDGYAPPISRAASTEIQDGSKEETTIMVDQLWIWILGDGLIVTCGAQRWNELPPLFISPDYRSIFQRFQDSLSLDHGLEPCRITAGDAAMHFMTACFGTFDRHARRRFNLQFMSMFEQSIGTIGAKDSDLLRKFSTAYTALKKNKGVSRETFVEALNDLTTETDLLTELKDIRDELHIMNTILVDQQRVARSLLDLQMKVVRNHRTSLFSSVQVESARSEDQEEKFEPINTIIDQGLQDIAQLDAQAKRLSGSLSELLQLKQAHYNAFELEFSRDLALKAANQGRAVLVFTIVTIVFSPLSFVAAFFTMNLTVFPEELSLSYVSRYIFGFGFAVAVPCIALAFSLGWWTSSWNRVKEALYGTDSVSTVDRDGREKNESPKSPAQAGSTQAIDQLSNKSPAIVQGNEKRLSPSLRGDRSHETPKMTAVLKRRWRSWRNPEATDLPR
jgi:Mg2+ and Co2+ transporter CorA